MTNQNNPQRQQPEAAARPGQEAEDEERKQTGRNNDNARGNQDNKGRRPQQR